MIPKRDPVTGRIASTNVLERMTPFMGNTDDECWLMPPRNLSRGGHYRIRLDDKSRRMAHRVAWEAHNGMPVPDNLLVLHTCDNPRCFNPHHLYVGDQCQNMDDRFIRNRDTLSRKISVADTEVIFHSKEPTSILADRYGVTTARIRQIRSA